MKVRSFVVGCVLALTMQAGFCAAFQNLGFESPRFVPAPFAPDGSLTNAVLVGWVFYRGTNQFDELAYNYGIGGLDGVSANLWDGFINRFYMFTNLVDGKYAVYFHQEYVNNSPFAIAQTATIPSDAKFLCFKAAGYTGFVPSLNGEVPPLVDSVILGGVQDPARLSLEVTEGVRKTYDISAFAGKNIELRFTLHYNTFFNYGDGILDTIELLTDYARFYPSSVNLGTNGFTLSWVSIPSSKFQVESATNFSAVWQPIGPPVTSTNNTFIFTDTTITNQPRGQRFYRLRALP